MGTYLAISFMRGLLLGPRTQSRVVVGPLVLESSRQSRGNHSEVVLRSRYVAEESSHGHEAEAVRYVHVCHNVPGGNRVWSRRCMEDAAPCRRLLSERHSTTVPRREEILPAVCHKGRVLVDDHYLTAHPHAMYTYTIVRRFM